MKILFINPNHNWNIEARAYGSKSYLRVRKISPPLGIGYLIALARKNHHVKLIEANALDLNYSQVIEETKAFMPDVTAITSMYPSTESVINLASRIRGFSGMLIAGGADPTVRAPEYLQAFDIVNKGQGELSFQEFMGGTPVKLIKGFSSKANGQVIDNGVGQMVGNLDDLPFTPWDLFPLHKYKPATMQIKYSYPSAAIMTSRGCPNHCSYCAVNTVVPQFKSRSVKNIIEEITLLINNYHVTHIEFFDDTFTFDRQRVISLCNEILARKLKFRWSCITRPDRVDEELLRLMKRAGCYFTLYGVQTLDRAVLNNINRSGYREDIERSIYLAKKLGIIVRLDFILGLPGANLANMRDSLEFVKKTNPDIVDFYPLLWLPGTTLVEKYKPEYSDEYLERIAQGFYGSFYLRLRYIYTVLKNCSRPSYLWRYLQCFRALFMGMLTNKIARVLPVNERD
jgi:anaerobic magnesium-protoporphyrin IX monomethyl ester cyclase